MSVDQGLLSPPDSGRACKTDQPRLDGMKSITLHNIFGPTTIQQQPHHQSHQQHTYSPIKKQTSITSSTSPPTPPMTCDVRLKDSISLLEAPPCSSYSDGEIEENIVRLSQGSSRSTAAIDSRAVSEDRSQAPQEHFNSSASELESDDDTPATICDHTPDRSRPRVWDAPIRDTPGNPFLAGGPADQGFQGPRGQAARQRAREMPRKECGKITYVFRGQRVTYADPEYDSDDSEEWDSNSRKGSRPPRLQPKLLFPPTPPDTAPKAPGGGLFAAQLSRKRQLDEDQLCNQQSLAASRRLQQAVAMPSRQVTTQTDSAERRALLARLDQNDWSDDDEHDPPKTREEEEQIELVRPVKRLRPSLLHADSDVSQDQREVAFWLQDASQQRQTMASTKLVQRMKGR